MIINRGKRKRTSIIWTVPKEELQEVVKSKNSISDVLKHYNFGATGATHITLKKRLIEDGIDFSHIKMGYKSNEGRKFNFKKTKEECINLLFINNSNYPTKTLKDYIILYNLLAYKCEACRNDGSWNNKPLSLQLDHINGIRTDNRLENLRFLCPNCHSQTETFGARNHKEKERIERKCKKCGEKIQKSRGVIEWMGGASEKVFIEKITPITPINCSPLNHQIRFYTDLCVGQPDWLSYVLFIHPTSL